MNRAAYFKLPDGSFKKIRIWDIFDEYDYYKNHLGYPDDEKKFYQKFYKGKLYSLHKNPINRKRFVLCIKKQRERSFFRYYKNEAPLNPQETVAHTLFKEIISEFNVLVLQYYRDVVTLHITESDIEHKISANGNVYYADIYFKFYKSEPEEFFYKWNGELCFEIKHTHAVGNKKSQDCYNEGIAIFEHTISKTFLEMVESIDDSRSEKAVIDTITDKLKTGIYGEWVSNPSSERYIMIKDLQGEVQSLNNKLFEQQEKTDYYKGSYYDEKKAKELALKDCTELSAFKQNVQSKKLLRFLLRLYRIK